MVSENNSKVAILSIAVGENWKELKDISFHNKREYASRWGYDLHLGSESLDETRPIAWSKILLIEKHLAQYDWIFWSDADSIILNQTIALESIVDADDVGEEDVIIAEDLNGINTGSFFIRNSEWSFYLLNHIYHQYDPFINHPWWENAAFHYIYYGVADMIKGSKTFAEKYNCYNVENVNHFKLMPQKMFNSYPDNYSDGDFVIHLPGMANDTRIKLLKEDYLNKVIR